MTKRSIVILLSWFATSCVVQTEGIEARACWDLNGDGIEDAAEDADGNGVWDSLDCTGPRGDPGLAGDPGVSGVACWDLNGNGIKDVAEDADGNGLWDSLDCAGAPGVSPFAYAPNMKDIYYLDGKLGLGTTTPTSKLSLSGTGTDPNDSSLLLSFSDPAGSAFLQFQIPGGGGDITLHGPDHQYYPTTLRIATNGDGQGNKGKIVLASSDHGLGGEIVSVGPGRKLDVADYTDPAVEGGNGNCPAGYVHDDLNNDNLEQAGECWRHSFVVAQGNAGIGVASSDAARLCVGGTDAAGVAATLRLQNQNDGGADAFIAASDDSWAAGANKLLLGVGGPINTNGVRMTIDSNGHVGIGTTTPQSTLTVNGSVAITGSGDVYVSDPTKGVILRAPMGACFRLKVTDIGNIVTEQAGCPQ